MIGAVQSIAVFHTQNVLADVSTHTMAEFTQYPILSSADTAVTPMVMINASNDHQLFYKAYNDFTDLDPKNGDGVETTYKHSIDYYGYFDSYKCYDYDDSDNRFEPASVTSDKYCSGNWSGNFLNWSSMARIDAIRKILFGGARRVDTASETVLERTYLPNDAHSWAKYYAGSDINKLTPSASSEITVCNTTVASGNSESVDTNANPPLMRVAEGNYALWASNERWQCRWSEEKTASNANDSAKSGLNAASSNPSSATNGLDGDGDFVARVQACVSGLIGKENCKRYPSGYYKPRGLLQVYSDKIDFGMTSGSYTKNKSGGVLVKDVSSINDEIDATDGTFTKVYIGASNDGVAAGNAGGIINALSLWRIVKYRHGDGTYGTSGVDAENCTWGSSSFTDGTCQNWGNPFAEIFLSSIRYFAGEAVSSNFLTNDSALVKGLNTPSTWNCPLNDSNYCASLNIINFNASVISYDSDGLDDASEGIVALGAAKDSAGLTDDVGSGEGIHGKDFFVGENGTDNNQLCTSKAVSSLGQVEGLCAEAPRLEGSYRVAGLAHWAHTTDIRSATVGATELTDDQLIDTYSVALASSTPEIEVPVPGSTGRVVRILPACRELWKDSGTPSSCAIVDFKVVERHSESGGTGTGKFYINWEDTEQGGDYDQDMWGILEYEVTSSEIKVTTDVIADSTPYHMGFGYVISGTTNDGFHVHSGIDSFDYTDSSDPARVPGCTDCVTGDGPTTATYSVGSSTAGLLKDPLYYAAKWGGFKDRNDNGVPDAAPVLGALEWDDRDADWTAGAADGIPDNFFYATNPATLEIALSRVLGEILAKTASGTAAAVVSSSREGRGAIYQALYETEKSEGAEAVNWIGTVRAFWVDEDGYMREDDGDGVLESTDKIFELCYADSKVRYRYISLSTPPSTACESDTTTAEAVLSPPAGSKSIDDLKPRPIWDAGVGLSNTSAASRNIYTWIDSNYDDDVAASEVIEFTTSNIGSTNFGFLDVIDETVADELVDYVRGVETTGKRSRTLKGVTYLLGDIVNSTPTVVGTPAEAFDLLYKDTTYATFRKKYKDRRNMIYVGANDGMLHAFNGGFFSLDSSGNSQFTSGTGTALGEELWAYIPMNLLPHLKWLADPDYTHVFYMDAKPRVFDAKIFSSDTDHPGGWGTVLVAGMRLGGGPMVIDPEADGFGDDDDATMQSAYVVLDVTNPEKAPKVLAEIKSAGFGLYYILPHCFCSTRYR